VNEQVAALVCLLEREIGQLEPADLGGAKAAAVGEREQAALRRPLGERPQAAIRRRISARLNRSVGRRNAGACLAAPRGFRFRVVK